MDIETIPHFTQLPALRVLSLVSPPPESDSPCGKHLSNCWLPVGHRYTSFGESCRAASLAKFLSMRPGSSSTSSTQPQHPLYLWNIAPSLPTGLPSILFKWFKPSYPPWLGRWEIIVLLYHPTWRVQSSSSGDLWKLVKCLYFGIPKLRMFLLKIPHTWLWAGLTIPSFSYSTNTAPRLTWRLFFSSPYFLYKLRKALSNSGYLVLLLFMVSPINISITQNMIILMWNI
jgi:hypothetical protein